MDIATLDATALLNEYKTGRLSPVVVLKAVHARRDLAEPHLNAFCWQDGDNAMAQAKTSEGRWAKGTPIGVLDGIPFAAKDLCPMAGAPFRRGSHRTPDAPAAISSPLLTHVMAAGAVVVGKTTTPEFGWKGVTDSPLTGITRNPWNPARTPGGSSGGAAAAVASGMVRLAEGTDGAGSIRMPCAFTGLFGLYPTAGRIPYVPVSTLGTITRAGPITRSVRDGVLLFGAMMGSDPRDPIRLPAPQRDWTDTLEGGVAGLRLAYAPNLNGAEPDADVQARVGAALEELRAQGAVVVRVDDMFPRPVRPLFEMIYTTAMARIRSVYPAMDGVPIDPGFEAMADQGQTISAVALAEAMSACDEAAVAMNVFFQGYDALITPQMPTTAFAAGQDVPEGRGLTTGLTGAPIATHSTLPTRLLEPCRAVSGRMGCRCRFRSWCRAIARR